ncbi:MAG: hypothetical protein AAGF47_10570 [Planctomycetota bacterium]
MAHAETPAHEHTLDEWHAHSAAEPIPQIEHAAQVNRAALLVVFAAMVISIIVMVVGLTMFYNYTVAQRRAVVMENVVEYKEEYKPYHAVATGNIENYRSLGDGSTVQIPVDRAARLVAERYANN